MEYLVGKEALERMKEKKVLICGVGGVGSFVAEALARSGVGYLTLLDYDKVEASNLNRQLHATRKTVGQYKVDVARDRILEINPDCVVQTHKTFYMPETAAQFDFTA